MLRVILCRLSFMKIASHLFSILACGAVVFACIPVAFSKQPSHRLFTGPISSFPPVHLAKTTSPPVLTVKNVRMGEHPTYTRVVLDMTGKVTVRKTRDQTRAMITLANSTLSSRAQQAIKSKTLPRAVTISQGPSHTVNITLQLKDILKYTFHTYQDPHRVVVDLFHTPPPPPPPPFRLIIDPGHGGKDPGAIGKGGTREKTIVLQIAKIVRDLVQTRLKAEVFLTRSTDVFLELEERVEFAEKFAEKKEAALFLSIHANSHTRRSIQGVEIYYLGQASDAQAWEVAARENGKLRQFKKGDPAGQFIADKWHEKKIEASRIFAWTTNGKLISVLQKGYPIKDHGVKTAPFHVLSGTMPGILAEIGFISNPTEEKRLQNKAYQRKLAEGIYQGIKQCTQTSKKSSTPSCLLPPDPIEAPG